MKKSNTKAFSQLTCLPIALSLKPLFSFALLSVTLVSQAAVFDTRTRRPAIASGHTVVNTCIVDHSEMYVITAVRKALSRSWGRNGAIRFVGWEPCSSLSPIEQAQRTGVYINGSAPNTSYVGTGSIGVRATPGDNVSFKPWGNSFNRCSEGSDFSCAQQYAIHEFGHALGFAHEHLHPRAAAVGCRHQAASAQGFNFANPNQFDFTSMMTYDFSDPGVNGAACVDHRSQGVRFGGVNLSVIDEAALHMEFPAVPGGTYDVGVIPDGKSCGKGQEPPVIIYMDDEDDNNGSHAQGWTGAFSSDRNTTFRFCRVNGLNFHPLCPGNRPQQNANYAVLKLGAFCPPGATEVSRYFDNQDNRNESFADGSISPNVSNDNTHLLFCMFRPQYVDSRGYMNDFPNLGFPYGVIAHSDIQQVVGARHTGNIRSDDEDNNNRNTFVVADGGAYQDALKLIEAERNTVVNLAKVNDVSAHYYSGFRWQVATAFPHTNGQFAMKTLPNNDLMIVKKQGASGTTEVHIATAASGYQSFALQVPTPLHLTDSRFAFELMNNNDLAAIKKSDTGSGKTELHVLTASSHYQQFSLQTATALELSDDTYQFEMMTNNDLMVIQHQPGTIDIRIRIFSAASGYQTEIKDVNVWVDSVDVTELEFEVFPNGDLLVVDKAGSRTNKTLLHLLTAATDYRGYRFYRTTPLQPTDQNFEFDLSHNGDLMAIKKNGASGKTEVHILAH